MQTGKETTTENNLIDLMRRKIIQALGYISPFSVGKINLESKEKKV
jgi:hypothetical protein